MANTVRLRFPFTGRWLARNSPANRVPSHGTHLFGTTYAIDFVAVDGRGRSAPSTWHSVLSTERPDGFVGFGAPILAPAAGTVVVAHDGEPDHAARRSQLALLPYALSQPGRIRAGAAAIAGNHVVIALASMGPYVLLAHLKCGSVDAAVGTLIDAGQPVGACGNSGNSTEPHVHVQASDSLDGATARGIPIGFEHPDGTQRLWLPRNSEVFVV